MTFHIASGALLANNNVMKLTAHDVANANDIGFKKSTGYFQSLTSGAPGIFSGGGVMATGIQNVSENGNLQPSTINTNMAVVGNGFFITSPGVDSAVTEYTRNGTFVPDSNGYLCNAAGAYLKGWKTDSKGVIPPTTNVSDVASLDVLNVANIIGQAKATENMTLGYTLPSSEAYFANDPSRTIVKATSVYDNLGGKHDVILTWKKLAVVSPSTWELSITCPDATVYKDDTTGLPGDLYGGNDGLTTPMTVVFDSDGRPSTYDGAATPPGIYFLWDVTKTSAEDTVTTLDLGTIGTAEGLTCLDVTEAVVTRNRQDGAPIGDYRNVSINDTGLISVNFSNGSTSVIGQIALASFVAPNFLEAQSGCAWIETQESGTYLLGKPKSGVFGKIQPSALEGSTVDLTSKLTDMIDLQNHYSANTKTISAYKKEFEDLLRIF